MPDVAVYVAEHFRIPRHGPMYVRCRVCNAQVFLPRRVGLQRLRAVLLLSIKLKDHMQRHKTEGC